MQTVDLHGMRHKDVSDAIVRCCSEYDIPFVVITGQSSRMKRIVAFAAAKFKLSVRDTIDNPGRVIVYEGR